jgi:inosose dehydratase
MDRRTFLLTPALAVGQNSKDRLAAGVYIWTQDLNQRKVALADGLDEIFASTRRAGFSNMELMAQLFTPELKDKTLAAMKKHGVKAPGIYMGGNMHTEEGGAKMLEAARRMADIALEAGAGHINHNPDPKPGKARKTDEELKIQARNINRVASMLADKYLGFYVHHHDPEIADNAYEWRHILQNTDIQTVGLCVDTHWVLRGGQIPQEIIREAGRRLKSIHVRQSQNNVWAEDFGEGDIDYKAMAKQMSRDSQEPLVVVELAREKGTPATRTLEENLRRSRKYAQSVFGL